MTKIGRNQPCPCGSGKKYKQCCLAADEASALAARDEQRRTQPPPPATSTVLGWGPDVDDVSERLDQLSNGAVDLIHDGRFDEAERMSGQLLTEFPDLPDGHMRLGQLHRARGNPKQAAEHLRCAAAIARTDHNLELAESLQSEADILDPPAS